jgi:hypothetical protein
MVRSAAEWGHRPGATLLGGVEDVTILCGQMLGTQTIRSITGADPRAPIGW